jgi:hypothetical protein
MRYIISCSGSQKLHVKIFSYFRVQMRKDRVTFNAARTFAVASTILATLSLPRHELFSRIFVRQRTDIPEMERILNPEDESTHRLVCFES